MYFGMMLNISTRICNAEWCVSFNEANVSAGTGFLNSSIKSLVASVAASADKILGIFTLCGKKTTMLEMRSDLVLVTKVLNYL